MAKFKPAAPYDQLQGKLHGQKSNYSARVNSFNGKQHT